MEGRLLAKARSALAEKQRRNHSEENRRRAEIYESIPEIRTIDGEIRALMSELVALALGTGSHTAAELESASLTLQDRRAALLRAHGYDAHYLDEILSCPICGDTGFLSDGKPCACLIRLYNAEQTRELSPLLKNGQVKVCGLYSEKTGKNYDAVMAMEDNGQQLRYRLLFGKQ